MSTKGMLIFLANFISIDNFTSITIRTQFHGRKVIERLNQITKDHIKRTKVRSLYKTMPIIATCLFGYSPCPKSWCSHKIFRTISFTYNCPDSLSPCGPIDSCQKARMSSTRRRRGYGVKSFLQEKVIFTTRHPTGFWLER